MKGTVSYSVCLVMIMSKSPLYIAQQEMYDRYPWLIPTDIVISKYYDRHLDWDGADKHLMTYGEKETSFTPSPLTTDLRPWVEKLLCNWKPTKPWQRLQKEYDVAALAKYWGPNGKVPDYRTLFESVDRYYHPYQGPVYKFSEWAISAFDRLFGYPRGIDGISSPRQLFNTYRPTHASSGGLTVWADRRIMTSRAAGMRAYARDPLHVDPCVIGTRWKYKLRDIFMTSFADQFRYNALLHPLKQWCKSSSAVAWRGDHAVEHDITQFLRKCREPLFIEGDYDAMDTRFSMTHAMSVVDVWKRLGWLKSKVIDNIEVYLTSMFNSPILMPIGLSGARTHTLISGTPPTNDFESWWSILNQLEMIYRVLGPVPLNGIMVLVLGDDALLIVDVGVIPSALDVDWAKTFASWSSNEMHMMANEAKQRVSDVSGWFCKRQYAHEMPMYADERYEHKDRIKSSYSVVLALESIQYPERSKTTSYGAWMCRLLQILDNSWGHPLYKTVAHTMKSVLHADLTRISQDDVDEYNRSGTSWKKRLNDELFSLSASPTYQIWVK